MNQTNVIRYELTDGEFMHSLKIKGKLKFLHRQSGNIIIEVEE